jgi:hypothetical protein
MGCGALVGRKPLQQRGVAAAAALWLEGNICQRRGATAEAEPGEAREESDGRTAGMRRDEGEGWKQRCFLSNFQESVSLETRRNQRVQPCRCSYGTKLMQTDTIIGQIWRISIR